MPAKSPEALARKSAAQKAKRAASGYYKNYNKTHKHSGERITQKSGKLQFVAIDSEGMNFGAPFSISDSKDTFQEHRTILWGASNVRKTRNAQRADESPAECAEGYKVDWLYRGTKTGLRAKEILEWLCNLPNVFGRSIFVTFASGYDFTQVLRDMPFSLARELRDNGRNGINNWCRWEDTGFAVRYVKGKFFCAARYRWDDYANHGNGGYKYEDKITVYDVFGFFQESFLKSLSGVPGAVDPADMETLKTGKGSRADFANWNVREIKKYTALELHYLCVLMNEIRKGIEGLGLEISRWLGAGSIAGALLQKYEVSTYLDEAGKRQQVCEMSVAPEPDSPQGWAHHAFFGGRIEMCLSGKTSDELFEYDISSAYPAACTGLPSMRGGRWIDHPKTTREMLSGFSPVSMIKIRWAYPLFGTKNKKEPHFYPLPYRYEDGRIEYNDLGLGIYMVEEIRAALALVESYGMLHCVELLESKEFIPDPEEPLPFAFVPELFQARADMKDLEAAGGPYNIMEKIIKLGLNSLYGKMAQRVGGNSVKTDGGNYEKKAPVHANTFYAAAITAWTRARMMEAALGNPLGIVHMATDGIVSTAPLALPCPSTKTLGLWELKKLNGGVFVMSGLYDAGGKYKSRGFNPTSIAVKIHELLHDEIPAAWARGAKEIHIAQHRYLTFGAACASEERWALAGHWYDTTRTLNIESAGSKRRGSERGREKGLRRTWPPEGYFKDILSHPAKPDWLDTENMEEYENIKEIAEINLGRFST